MNATEHAHSIRARAFRMAAEHGMTVGILWSHIYVWKHGTFWRVVGGTTAVPRLAAPPTDVTRDDIVWIRAAASPVEP